jgi:hypothetical protein
MNYALPIIITLLNLHQQPTAKVENPVKPKQTHVTQVHNTKRSVVTTTKKKPTNNVEFSSGGGAASSAEDH